MLDRTMPIIQPPSDSQSKTRGDRPVRVDDIPWEMFGRFGEEQALKNHGHTLEVLAQRGGVSAPEAVYLLSGLPLLPVRGLLGDDDAAHRILYAMRSLFRRGALLEQQALVRAETPCPS